MNINKLIKSSIREKIIDKIRSDMLYGFKILGTYENKFDTIRVCTVGQDVKFVLVATSSSRFKGKFSSIEIQSFYTDKKTIRFK